MKLGLIYSEQTLAEKIAIRKKKKEYEEKKRQQELKDAKN